jgi:hypothetical protein
MNKKHLSFSIILFLAIGLFFSFIYIRAGQETCHTSSLWSWNYCSSNCECYAGEGDCDTDAQCHTGYCAKNVGAKYGKIFLMDVCEERDVYEETNEINIFFLKDFRTCIVGDKCTNVCIPVARKDETIYMEFEDNDNFKALKPSDPTVNNYEQKICLNPILTDSEISDLENEVNLFISEVKQWTNESIILSPNFIEISGEITMTKYKQGLHIVPQDSEFLIKSFITKDTDFVTVSHDMYDDILDIVIPVSLCGGALGSDWGVGGAGYNCVMKTHPGLRYECAHKGTYMHEWLNVMDWILPNVSGVSDIYNGVYPACGKGDANTYLWFPSASYDSIKDPDFEACGYEWEDYYGYPFLLQLKVFFGMDYDLEWHEHIKCCNLKWHKHILTEHYNPNTILIGNHCRNNKKDFDETGVDCGGKCSSCQEKSIDVLSPDGGEKWKQEQSYEIKWQSPLETEKVGIVLYKGSQTVGIIARDILAKASKITWSPGFEISEGEDYYVGIYQYPWKQNNPVDYSSNFFTIKK